MAKYLHIVPLKFAQIELSVKMLLDITTLSVKEVMGRLKVAERHHVAKVNYGWNQLYIMRLDVMHMVYLLVQHNDNMWHWHARYGQISLGLRSGLGRSHMGYNAIVYEWGRSSGGFSTCVRRSFSFIAMPGGGLTPCRSSFLYNH